MGDSWIIYATRDMSWKGFEVHMQLTGGVFEWEARVCALTFWTLQRTHVLLKFLVLGYPGWQGFWFLPQPSMMFSGSILLLFCLYPIYWYMTCRAGAQQMLLMWAETKMQASITTVVVITLTMRLSTICRWTWNPRISGICILLAMVISNELPNHLYTSAAQYHITFWKCKIIIFRLPIFVCLILQEGAMQGWQRTAVTFIIMRATANSIDT